MKKTYIYLLLILGLGTALRFYHNTDISLWHDEAFSALLIKYHWGEMLRRIALDVHPPMYYIALRWWSNIFSSSMLALRSFSVTFGVLTAAAAYLFTKTAFKNERAGLVAALLVAVSPFQLQYATEARMYTFGAFFALLAAYFLVKALREQIDLDTYSLNPKKRFGYFIAFGVSVLIMILTHYYLLFTAAALCFYGLAYIAYHRGFHVKAYAGLAVSYAIIIVGFLPWVPTFLFQYKQVGSGYWIPPMDIWSIPTTIWQMFIGLGIDISHSNTKIIVAVVTILSIVLIARFLFKTKFAEKWLVILGLIAPFGGAILFAFLAKLKGESSSVYLVRYFLYASSFYTIIIAYWLSTIRFKAWYYLLTVMYVGASLWSFGYYWHDLDITKKPGMFAAAKVLANNVTPNDTILVGSSFEFFNLKYYLSQNLGKGWTHNQYGDCSIDCLSFGSLPRPRLYSGSTMHAHELPHFAGTAILTDQDLQPGFDFAKKDEIVWVLWTNAFGGNKPEVPKNWYQLDEKGYADVRPYVGTWIIVTEYQVR